MDYIWPYEHSFQSIYQARWCIFGVTRKRLTRRTGNILPKWLFHAHSVSQGKLKKPSSTVHGKCTFDWRLFVFVKHVLRGKPYNFISNECFHAVAVWFGNETLPFGWRILSAAQRNKYILYVRTENKNSRITYINKWRILEKLCELNGRFAYISF